MALPWSQPGWLDDVTTWIDESVERTGPLDELHRRAWSAMMRMPTRDGIAYFKAAAPAFLHEAPLVEALARWRPDCTAALLAVDARRGWILMRDSGETLRGILTRDPSLKRFEPLLTRYARLQLELAVRREEVLALGVPDRRLVRLAELGAELPVDADLVRRLVEEVESYEVPETLVHEEVHEANVLIRDGVEVFIDWGDSSVGHPFFGIVVALRSVADRFGLEPGAPELERLVDAYLEPWTLVTPRKRLRALFPAAYRLGMLNRALSWQATVRSLEAPERAEFSPFVAAWLEEFLHAEAPRPGT